jgi:hypothetical protein
VNVEIMRAFVRLRAAIVEHRDLARRLVPRLACGGLAVTGRAVRGHRLLDLLRPELR